MDCYIVLFCLLSVAVDKQGRQRFGCQFVTPVPDKSAVNAEVWYTFFNQWNICTPLCTCTVPLHVTSQNMNPECECIHASLSAFGRILAYFGGYSTILITKEYILLCLINLYTIFMYLWFLLSGAKSWGFKTWIHENAFGSWSLAVHSRWARDCPLKSPSHFDAFSILISAPLALCRISVCICQMLASDDEPCVHTITLVLTCITTVSSGHLLQFWQLVWQHTAVWALFVNLHVPLSSRCLSLCPSVTSSHIVWSHSV